MTADAVAVPLFWLCAGIVAYTYVGYPLLIHALARLRPAPVARGDERPGVTLIIAAYDEERVIRAKLENTLALDYPAQRLEVILVADGSTDRTVAIAREFEARGVRVLHRPERRGKSAALNRAVPEARWDIVLFSDANTDYAPDVVHKMVRNFADPRVGGVSGRKVVVEDAQRAATRGERAFWTYESWLKVQESRVGSIVVADGEIFAMRRALYRPIPDGIVHDDMYQTLSLVRAGHRVVYEAEAESAEHASRSLRDEFHLKVRYASAGYQIFFAFLDLFVPPRSLFAVQFLSHKLLRWMAPLFLIGLLAASAAIGWPPYRGFFWLQVGFYLLALVALPLPRSARLRPLYFPLYFCMGNAAALHGLLKFLGVGQSALWRKAER